MRTERHYCKYCGKPYSYQISGNGCFDELNNSQFCPECMEIMLKALKKAGIQEHRYYKKLKEISVTDEQLKTFKTLDNKFEEELKNSFFPTAYRLMPIYDYKHIVGYNYNRQEFFKCWNKDDESDVIWLTQYLYDSQEQKYLEIYYNEDALSTDYRFSCSGQKTIKAEDVKPINLEPPSSKLLYLDCIGNSDKDSIDVKPFDISTYLKDRNEHPLSYISKEYLRMSDEIEKRWLNKFNNKNELLDKDKD